LYLLIKLIEKEYIVLIFH